MISAAWSYIRPPSGESDTWLTVLNARVGLCLCRSVSCVMFFLGVHGLCSVGVSVGLSSWARWYVFSLKYSLFHEIRSLIVITVSVDLPVL